MGLPVQVEHPALVCVSGADVGCLGDDGGGIDAPFVGDIVDGQGVFVVAVADFLALVLLVGPVVDDALSVVDISVLASASRGPGVGWIGRVDEDQASPTRAVSWLSSDHSNPISAFGSLHDVVGSADGQIVE